MKTVLKIWGSLQVVGDRGRCWLLEEHRSLEGQVLQRNGRLLEGEEDGRWKQGALRSRENIPGMATTIFLSFILFTTLLHSLLIF